MRKKETLEASEELVAAYKAEAELEVETSLKAWAKGDIRHTSGWEGECAREAWSQKKRVYNKQYRERHVERLHAFRPIYKQRERAKRLGLQQFPLPTWDQELGGLEIPFE